ncbi:MAG: major facilitator superfamily 1 [Pedosphaera sp.]|nr:major facilitator superfamily 1 [Pedosphaera sp.]
MSNQPQAPAGAQQNIVPPEKQPGLFAGVTAYHWLVLIIAAGGWLFDCMGQRIFVLAREPAMRELLSAGTTDAVIKSWGGYATFTLMIGWATGGILFGKMSDRYGRVKTMIATLLAYTFFSGLTGLARTPVEFLIYRFLGGMGIGGMFGAATTLVAESMPSRVRPLALGLMQALSAFGNITGSLLSLWIQPGQADFFHGYSGWRWIFFAGAIPAILVVPIALVLREPEPWKEAKRKAAESKDSSQQVGSMATLFTDPRWRKHVFVGLALGLAGMAGLWGIGFFSPELISTALKGEPQKVVDTVRSYGTALQDAGAFLGMLTFTFVATYIGRRVAFLCAFILCLGTTIFVFNNLRSGADAYWMLPMMGFAQLSVFGGYSIYFPELFPTRLRGTGVGFCYNTVRYLAAVFPLMLGALNASLLQQGVAEPFRKAATVLSLIFVLGLVALIWAPETKGKPLPE